MALPTNWRIERHPSYAIPMYYVSRPPPTVYQWIRPIPPPGYTDQWPPYYHAAHILVKHRDVRTPFSKNRERRGRKITISSQEAKERILQIRKQILEGGESFEEKARKESDCSSSDRGGDLGWAWVGGGFHPVFEENALRLEIGGDDPVSEPFETPSGWHIVKRLDGLVCNDARNLKDPPPLEFLLEMRSVKDYVWIEEGQRKELLQGIIQIERNGRDGKQWHEILELYAKCMGNLFTPMTKRLIQGYLFYHRDRNAFEYVKEFLGRKFELQMRNRKDKSDEQVKGEIEAMHHNQVQVRGEFQEQILQTILEYTWNPYFWLEWVKRTENTDTREERIQKQRKMLDSVGFTTDTAKIWEQLVRLMKEAQMEPEVLKEVVTKGLTIGLSHPDGLLAELRELDPAAAEEMKNRISQPVFQGRVRAREHILKLKPEQGDSACREMRKFLDEELANPLGYPKDLFAECMDYMYRLALSVMWDVPSIWMEYWSFLVKSKTMSGKAERVLRLGRAAVGDTPKFELRRAQHLIRYNQFPDAEKILYKLVKYPEPLCTSALTLLFRAVADREGEEKAMHIITDNLQYARAQFFANAARMCKDPKTAWSIFQLGVDTWPEDDKLVIAAAEFLEQQRDVRNTRLLFQQSLNGDKRERFEVRRQLFQFELDHIAPLDHLNETQKVFMDTSIDPLVLYMQRYRFMDLYPIPIEELRVLGHMTATGSFDLIDSPKKDFDYLTTIPPYKVDKEIFKRDQTWIEKVEDNNRRTAQSAQPQQQQKLPPAIYHLKCDIKGCKLQRSPPDVDTVIDVITRWRPEPSY